ncbi:trem-like transcript 4 protein [Pipistrellus kuhlii]|uniref:Triggering receptor expressed on myeloid cells like 4 n=1 Tax=Pipistrellus kuhlii TaxID=59472 RepID=A0A7J7YPW6_PIPKU|nr:trem-like transcript 4 protein [Pipistrellus kuhlii]KAF6363849.1 triggering receptor expressed on myeloid cells like 4 [Pipistrellus kuhlii]
MAWGAPCLLLPPVLLVFLASGSRGQVVSEELHYVAGQTLSVRCQYFPEGGSYRQKTWCRQTSPNFCTRLVTSSGPQTQDSRYVIWDVPDAGFFNISMAQLTEKDSGPYWCGIYNSSRNMVTISRNISLLVSPALTPSPWTTAWPLESTVRITSPEGTSGPPSLNGSELRKSSAPLAPGWAASCILVAVLCGLFAAKGLVLAVLCVLLSCRRWAQGSRGLGGDSSDGEF